MADGGVQHAHKTPLSFSWKIPVGIVPLKLLEPRPLHGSGEALLAVGLKRVGAGRAERAHKEVPRLLNW